MSWKGVCGILLASLFVTSVATASTMTEMRADHQMRVNNVQKRADGVRFDLELDAPVVVDVPLGDGYGQVLEIPGAGMIQEEGLPTVPMLSRMFRMPPSGGAHAVVLDSQYETMTGLEYAAYMGMENDEFVFGELDDTVDEWYPGTLAEVTDAAIARQFRVANLITYPVQVNAYRNEVRVYSNIDVDVQYGGPGVNELQSYPRALSASYLSFYRDFLDWEIDEIDDFEIYHGAVQLVAKNAAVAQMGEWIEWKRQKGYKIELLTESDASWSSNGIKSELQSRWDNSEYKFDWVVIVGDNSGAYLTPPGAGYGDHYYVKLDGNDELPEAGVGRISVDTQQELIAYQNKVFFYEREPYMDDTDWYLRGCVGAGSASSGISTVYLGRYARHAALDIGYTEVDTAWYLDGSSSWVNSQNQLSIEEGVSFYSYRGWLGTGLDNGDILNLTNYFMLPMVLQVTCGEGDWTFGDDKNESWMLAGSVNEPAGGIGAIATATSSTHTRYNNAVSGGALYSNLVLREKEMGNVIFWSKVNLYNSFHPWASGQVANFAEWTNMMGDPTVWLWTDIPRPLEVQHPSSVEYGRHGYEVIVTDDNGSPEPDAWVCLYKNDAEDDTVAFGITDAGGRVVLDVPFTATGMAKLTVTKQNHHPYQTDVPCEVNQLMAVTNVQVVDNGQAGTNGDGDGLAEPGEIIGLWVRLHNMYPFNAPRVGAVFTTDDPMISQTGGVAQFGTIQSGQQENATSLVLMQVSEDAQSGWIVDGTLGLGIIPQGGGQPNVLQEDIVTFKIHAPEYTYVNHEASGIIEPGTTVGLEIDVANIGLSDGSNMFAQLVSTNPYLIVQSGQSPLPNATVGQTVTSGGHEITSHPESFTGYPATANLLIGNADGWVDTVKVTIPLGTPTATDPVGPDDYGYIAFEDRDTDYDIAPVYDWVEINPNVANNDYNGTALDINDSGEEDDDADLIDLPFDIQFYGETFDQMTITCNGFVAFGDQQDMRTPRNWPIPSPLGPNYMIAPYWDDRQVNGADSGVFYYYDAPNGRMIIEWYSVADVYQWGGPQAWNTFQMIIYDQVGEHITVTGDNNILFQYEDVTHTAGEDFDNDYCTVGIENGDQSDGLQIVYWDSNDDANATITNGRAILITTQAALITGTVSGQVTFAANGDPVVGATVHSEEWAYVGTTDDQGNYTIEDVVIGQHAMTVEMQGINPQTETVIVEENLVTTQDYSVTAPGIDFSPTEISETLPPNDTVTNVVTISNPGDGELEWSVAIDVNGPGGPVTDEEFDLLDDFQIGWDSRNRGVTFLKGYFWVAGSNGNSNPNGLYRINPDDGSMIQAYPQPVDNPTAGGFNCITTDGEYLYGIDDEKLHKISYNEDTNEIALVSAVDMPVELALTRYLAYDKDLDLFWVGERFTPLYSIDRDANIVTEYNTGMSILAVSYFEEDPDGYNLWFALQENAYVDITLMKMDTATGDTLFVTNLPANVYQIKDLHISYLWDPFLWTVAILKDGSALYDDLVEVYEIAPNTAWMQLSDENGTIPPGGDQSLSVTLASLDLPDGTYAGWLRFDNNTFNPSEYLPVSLTVSDGAVSAVGDELATRPLEWKFNGVYPNPFNPTATVSFSMKQAANAKAVLYNVLGQQVATLVDRQMQAGHHEVMIQSDGLSSGVYFLRFSAGPLQETRKVVLLR